MITRHDIELALRALDLSERSRVLVHASYRAFGGVEGGPLAVVRALVESLATAMMPAFTWERTAVRDERGLFEGNAYAREPPPNAAPVPFRRDLPIDRGLGVLPETFRTSYQVHRSGHPLLSFVAYGELAGALAGPAFETDGVAPIARLLEANGDVLLLGVMHTSSTAVHLAEQLTGRVLFTRYALTDAGVRAVQGGGCGRAFDDLQPHVEPFERRTTVGRAALRCYRLRPYVEAARALIERDPYALLCDCERCRAHKGRVAV